MAHMDRFNIRSMCVMLHLIGWGNLFNFDYHLRTTGLRNPMAVTF